MATPRSTRRWTRAALCGLVLIGATTIVQPSAHRVTAGAARFEDNPQVHILPNGRLVSPTGTLYSLGDFPLGLAISPDGALAVASDSGQGIGLNDGKNSYCNQRGDGAGGLLCPYLNSADPTIGDPATQVADEGLSVVDLRSGQTSTVRAVPTSYNPATLGAPGTFNFFYSGVAFSRDGSHLYAAGGGNDAIYDFPVSNGAIAPQPARTVTLPPAGLNALKQALGLPPALAAVIGNGFTKGLAVTPNGRYLLVTHEINNSLDIVDTTGGNDTPVKQVYFGTPLFGGTFPGGQGIAAYPYGVVASADSSLAYVALQGANAVAVVNLQAGAVQGLIPAGDHPTALALSPDGSLLYVTNTNDDTLSVVLTATGQVVANIPLHVLPNEQLGAMPDAVAVSPDGRRVYVALAGDNAVAVLDNTAQPGAAPTPADLTLRGAIPTGWYPTGVAVSPDGRRVYAISAKGDGSNHPIPTTFFYDGNNLPGLLQSVVAPDDWQLQLGQGSVALNTIFAKLAGSPRSPYNPIPPPYEQASGDGRQGSPITHVVLVVRENRTFDQVLGDAGAHEGRTRWQIDGDPTYTIFGRDTTPNAHALVGDPQPGTVDPAYATSDNFWSDGEASVQGHYWTSSANVTDYIEKSWRQYYSPRNRITDQIASLAEPRNCSIFQSSMRRRSASGGAFTFRDYGELVGTANPAAVAQSAGVPLAFGNASPGVTEHCMAVPSADINLNTGTNIHLDIDNRTTAQGFLSDVGLNTDGTPVSGVDPSTHFLRNFSYLLMGGDHTGGLAFANTPRSRVAQNDAGLGLLVQALSHSSYWSSTAIFVLEDDSQDGLDHRDGHRNLLYVISPYARHQGLDGKPGYISHYHYDQSSVLKTIELILGLPYLSTYDQNADALYDLFQNKDQASQLTAEDLAPYTVQPAPSFIDETSAQYRQANPLAAYVPAAESRSLYLGAPDVAGPMLEIVNWQLAHPGAAIPAPLIQERSQWRPYAFMGSASDGN